MHLIIARISGFLNLLQTLIKRRVLALPAVLGSLLDVPGAGGPFFNYLLNISVSSSILTLV